MQGLFPLSSQMIFIWLIFLILFGVLIDKKLDRSTINQSSNMNQSIFSSCRKLTDDQLITQILKQKKFQLNATNWKFHITCKDDYASGKINQLKIDHPDQKIMGISGKWTLGSKHKLWIALENHYGRSKASQIMPESYVLNRDLNLLEKQFSKQSGQQFSKQSGQQLYLLKKDIQRQKGIKLTTNLNEIKQANQEGYVIAQKYLGRPYLYQGHKINLRIYLLIVCHKGKQQAYLYRDGIISYAGELYQDQSSDVRFKQGVSSFYDSKKLYQVGFPITWSELKQRDQILTKSVWSQIQQLTRQMLRASCKDLGKFRLKYNNTSFELFGMDIFLDEKLRAWLIEVNVGPGMTPYNNKDDRLRRKLYTDMFARLGIMNDQSNDNLFEKLSF